MKKNQEPSDATKANLKLNKQFNQEDGKNMDNAPFVFNQSSAVSGEMNRIIEEENEKRKNDEGNE